MILRVDNLQEQSDFLKSEYELDPSLESAQAYAVKLTALISAKQDYVNTYGTPAILIDRLIAETEAHTNELTEVNSFIISRAVTEPEPSVDTTLELEIEGLEKEVLALQELIQQTSSENEKRISRSTTSTKIKSTTNKTI